jgi:hypothetical protein
MSPAARIIQIPGISQRKRRHQRGRTNLSSRANDARQLLDRHTIRFLPAYRDIN